jgi:cytidine deaminase
MNQKMDQSLVESAYKHLEENFVEGERYVAAVLRTADGKEFKAMHMRHFANKMCSELAALIVLINSGEEIKQPLTCAAAMYVDGEATIMSPCGRCRQVLGDHFPSINFIVNDKRTIKRVTLPEMLPYLYLKDGAVA